MTTTPSGREPNPRTRPARRLTASAAALALALVTAAVPAAAGASPLGSLAPLTPCDGPAPRVATFGEAGTPVLGWRENLAFDGRGRMWVTSLLGDRVEAFDSTGHRVASVPVVAPGGVAVTPAGEVAVVTGASPTSTRSTIVAFDPDAADPIPRLVATVPAGKNGLAVDADGNMYTTGVLAPTVIKVRPDGSIDEEWSARAAIVGSNGIAIRDRTAFVTVTTSVDTAVHEVPLDDPAASRATALTRPPALPRGLDDLAVTDRAIYAVAFTGGEVLRIDRDSGAACVLAGGIPAPTSVRVAEGFGGFGPTDLFVTSADGSTRHIATT